MNETELKNFIRSVIREMLAPIMMGQTVSNETSLYGTVKHIGKSSPMDCRTVLPYGFFSRAPSNTGALMIPVNGDPSHINVVGHADDNRPDCPDGAVGLYDSTGQAVYLYGGKLYFGSMTSAQPMVLGSVLQSLLEQLLTTLATHTHPGIGAPPTEAGQFQSMKSSPVADGAMLSDISFTQKD